VFYTIISGLFLCGFCALSAFVELRRDELQRNPVAVFDVAGFSVDQRLALRAIANHQ
jgi:hypothetical protein